ncbi:hypothetical protein PSUB009319_15910 [Ralstonia sp. SET104]|nr:hypothetical protein PSUB009319_15910 [Ralstonia sp. SET104]
MRHIQISADKDALAGKLAFGDEIGQTQDVRHGSYGRIAENGDFTRCDWSKRAFLADTRALNLPGSTILPSPIDGSPAEQCA